MHGEFVRVLHWCMEFPSHSPGKTKADLLPSSAEHIQYPYIKRINTQNIFSMPFYSNRHCEIIRIVHGTSIPLKTLSISLTKKVHMTGYARSRDYVENLSRLYRTPHWSQHPTEKDDPGPVVADSDPLVANSVQVFCARNSQREGRILPQQGQNHLFHWDVGISVGFFTETTGSLRNPETRHSPSHKEFPMKRLANLCFLLKYDPFLCKGRGEWGIAMFFFHSINIATIIIIF